MNISVKSEKKTTFGSLCVGDPFKWNNQYFIKIKHTRYVQGDGSWSGESNMLCLYDGDFGFLADCEPVIRYYSCELS